MDPVFTEVATQLQAAFQNGGWLALLGTGLTLIIRVYRTNGIQSLMGAISERLVWNNWPLWLQRLLPFALPAIGAFILAMAGGATIIAALTAGVAAGITMGGSSFVVHKATKKVGDIEAMLKLRKDINYVPGSFRKASSLIVPIEGGLKKAKEKEGILGPE